MFYRLLYTGFGWMVFLETVRLTEHGWVALPHMCAFWSPDTRSSWSLEEALFMVLAEAQGGT